MEAKAYIKNVKSSPKKLRFLLPAIKKMSPEQALDYLYYSPVKGSKLFYKAIKSAITNSKTTLKTETNLLKFKVLTIDEGNKLKRYRPGGRGTSSPYKRRFAHITVVLEAPELKKQSKPEVKKGQEVKEKKKPGEKKEAEVKTTAAVPKKTSAKAKTKSTVTKSKKI